jgi:uncharacterized protein
MQAETWFVDTNLFLRYLTNDIPEQADSFERILKRAAIGEIHLVSNSMVIAEIVWTLESFYKLSSNQVQEKVLAILNTPGLEIKDEDLVLQAILWHDEKSVDFIDAYNAAWMEKSGLNAVLTFDRAHFNRFTGFRVVMPE